MKKRHYINHSNVSILIDKADLYDQSIEGKKRRDVVNYSLGGEEKSVFLSQFYLLQKTKISTNI